MIRNTHNAIKFTNEQRDATNINKYKNLNR